VNSESRARRPTSRAWAIIRRADRSHRLVGQRTSRPDRRRADRADRTSRPLQPQERGMVADARCSLHGPASFDPPRLGCCAPG